MRLQGFAKKNTAGQPRCRCHPDFRCIYAKKIKFQASAEERPRRGVRWLAVTGGEAMIRCCNVRQREFYPAAIIRPASAVSKGKAARRFTTTRLCRTRLPSRNNGNKSNAMSCRLQSNVSDILISSPSAGTDRFRESCVNQHLEFCICRRAVNRWSCSPPTVALMTIAGLLF